MQFPECEVDLNPVVLTTRWCGVQQIQRRLNSSSTARARRAEALRSFSAQVTEGDQR